MSGKDGFIRESHIDFRDAKFYATIIQILNYYIEQQKNNWVHPFKLLNATLIAIRAFEINENVGLADKTVNLLCRVRTIALEWIDKIEISIREMTNADESTERNLRLKLIYVAIIGGLTYFIHPKHKHYSKIFLTGVDSEIAVKSWLRFVISLKNNVRMYTNDEMQLSSNLVMFIRLVESIGVCVEDKVIEIIEQDSNFIMDVVQKQWSRADYRAIFNSIGFHHKFPHILDIKVVVDTAEHEHTVNIDLITGSFLVNNLPLSRLPKEVVDSESYRWFFRDIVLEVQPDAQFNFSTIQKYNNCSYEFKMINENVIIIEKSDCEKEFIHHSHFNEDFPNFLIKNYSHWLNRDKSIIEFRQRSLEKIHFSKETIIDYRLDLTKQCLSHVQTGRLLLDIKTDSYKKITQQLSRLEHPKYIHVYYAGDDVANVELFRMNLKFTVKCPKKSKHNCDLISNEFKGMIVSPTQNIDTLYGLNHGLVLESDKESGAQKNMILIPNGQIQIKTRKSFATVLIQTKNELRSPPFYQYQKDEHCWVLKSSNGSHASWFFLAYLHAITSLGEVESFLGMSGTVVFFRFLFSFSFSVQ